MITLDNAKKIAQDQFPDFSISSITDIGEEWAFSYSVLVNGYDTPVPGVPLICVNKASGAVRRLNVPPFENLDIIENGELIYSAE